MQFYLQSLSAVAKYVTEPLEVRYGGKQLFLGNDLMTSFQSLLNKIELKADPSNVDAQVGGQVRQPLEVVATNTLSGKNLAHLPVRYSFIKGSGELITATKTNSKGIALSRITKLTATDKLQIVKAELDIHSFEVGQISDPIFEILLKGFTLPNTRFILNVSNLAVYFEIQESLFGTPMTLPRIEPVLKESLSSQGFSFVDNVSKANVLIVIKADSHEGGNYQGLHTTYVDAQISVTDLLSGNEIYKMSYDNTKGISTNFKDAAIKAYDQVADKIKREVLPAVLDRIVK